MTAGRPVEVLIVGAGASGAAVAWRLAAAGVDVLCLDQGDWLDRRHLPAQDTDWERQRTISGHPDPNVRRLPEDYPIETSDTEGWTPFVYNGVGGSMIRWGGHFPRMHPSDFATHSLDGVARDWPLSYAELEPFYDRNDAITGVSGVLGDPAYPPRSAPRMPPLALGAGGRRVAAAFDRLGWHWWPSDAAVLTRALADREACNNCGPCGLGCVPRALGTVDVTYWPRALAEGARLETRARALEVTLDARGRANGVVYLDREGATRRRAADAVVIACNGIGTPRLLLLSRPAGFPDGLANSSGLVGRGLMHHPTGMVTGVFDEAVDGWKGPFGSALYSQEFYESDPARDFVRGYQMQLVRGDAPLGTALGSYLPATAWGEEHHASFARRFGRSLSLTVTAEDLPVEDNTVTLDPQLTDSSGLAAPRIRYHVDANAQRMIAHGLERASEALREAGAVETIARPLVAGAANHLLGTARMGEDPASSVVDRFGRAHDCANLFIVDGSVFVTSSAVNSTPTIQALALRTAEHMIATRGRRAAGD